MKIATLIIPLFFANAAFAQEENWGQHYYTQSCAECHGDLAKGGGPLAKLLTVEVPGLTTLAKDNDGEFPLLRVIHVIDGRSGLRAHGAPMPAYGNLFRRELESPMSMMGGAEPLIRGRVLSIAEYLISIQE